MGSVTLQIALAGIVAGLIAGMVMSMVMMGFSKKSGLSIWHMPNLIAATWLGPDARGERFRGKETFVGFATHMATSALMGIIFPL